jgi:hypothetical protein
VGEVYLKSKNSFKEFMLSSLNKKLAAKDLKGFPSRVVIADGQNPEPYKKLIDKRLEAMNTALKTEVKIAEDGGGGLFLNDVQNMCYRGNPAKILKILKSMMGNFLHDDQLDALRFGNYRHIEYKKDFFENNAEMRQNYADNGYADAMRDWTNYNPKSNTVLVLFTFGPQGDGTELLSLKIKPCKK